MAEAGGEQSAAPAPAGAPAAAATPAKPEPARYADGREAMVGDVVLGDQVKGSVAHVKGLNVVLEHRAPYQPHQSDGEGGSIPEKREKMHRELPAKGLTLLRRGGPRKRVGMPLRRPRGR